MCDTHWAHIIRLYYTKDCIRPACVETDTFSSPRVAPSHTPSHTSPSHTRHHLALSLSPPHPPSSPLGQREILTAAWTCEYPNSNLLREEGMGCNATMQTMQRCNDATHSKQPLGPLFCVCVCFPPHCSSGGDAPLVSPCCVCVPLARVCPIFALLALLSLPPFLLYLSHVGWVEHRPRPRGLHLCSQLSSSPCALSLPLSVITSRLTSA